MNRLFSRTISDVLVRLFPPLLISSWSLPALANFVGLEPLSLRPTSDSVHFFHVHDAYSISPYFVSFGLQGDLALDAMPLGRDATNTPFNVVDQMTYFNLLANVGILENLSFGVGLPVSVQQNRKEGSSGIRLASAGFSEIYMNAKWRFFDERDTWPGLALIPSINIPIYQSNPLIQSRLVPFNLELVASKRIGSKIHGSLNLGTRLRKKSRADVPSELITDDQFIYSIGGNYELSRLNSWIIAELHGSTLYSKFFKDRAHSPVELVAGPKFRLNHFLTIGTGAGYGIVKGLGNAKWRVFAQLNAHFNTRTVINKLVITRSRIELPEKVYFEFGSDRIEERSYQMLRDVAATIINEHRLKAVIVEGHTDSIGSEEYNQSLSERRVESVREFLVNIGVPPRMIYAKGYGERYPIATNETDEGRAINRRVEFRVVMENEEIQEIIELPPNDPRFEGPAPDRIE